MSVMDNDPIAAVVCVAAGGAVFYVLWHLAEWISSRTGRPR